jgi:hypothetical protein
MYTYSPCNVSALNIPDLRDNSIVVGTTFMASLCGKREKTGCEGRKKIAPDFSGAVIYRKEQIFRPNNIDIADILR